MKCFTLVASWAVLNAVCLIIIIQIMIVMISSSSIECHRYGGNTKPVSLPIWSNKPSRNIWITGDFGLDVVDTICCLFVE